MAKKAFPGGHPTEVTVFDKNVAMGDLSAAQLLERARSLIARWQPVEAAARLEAGAVLVDLRCANDRRAEGSVPHAVAIPRTVLEWRVDPESDWSDPRLADRTLEIILMCNDGYASSLAAATLIEMGFGKAADVDGGFRAWAAAGLPVGPTS